jgi:S-adenosylmethionine decarboxylase
VDTRGTHLLIELWECDRKALDSTTVVAKVMRKAARVAKAKPINAAYRHFDPQGVSGVMVVQESHLSVHTWPESGYAAIDIFTCGTTCKPSRAVEVFVKGFEALACEVREFTRGLPEGIREVGRPQEDGDAEGREPVSVAV